MNEPKETKIEIPEEQIARTRIFEKDASGNPLIIDGIPAYRIVHADEPRIELYERQSNAKELGDYEL